jgi:hypothetical protein
MSTDPKNKKTKMGEQASTVPGGDRPPPGLSPPVTLDGRPLLFVAVEGSAVMLNACPVMIAWAAGTTMPNATHCLRPLTDWLDKAWDHEHLAELSLSQQDLTQLGGPATQIAASAQEAIRGRCLVMQQPGLERLWLTELLTLQPEDICLHTVSLTSLALLLADRIGLDDDAIIAVVADRWFKLLARRRSAYDWALAAPILIQLILDEGMRRGLISGEERIALRTPKRTGGKRGQKRRKPGAGA